MSNLGEFSWSFIFRDCTQLIKRKKSSSLSKANRLLSLCLTSKEISHRSSEVAAKKCSKDCDARPKLSFLLQFNFDLLPFKPFSCTAVAFVVVTAS